MSKDDGSFSARGGWWVAAQVPVLTVAAALPPWTPASGSMLMRYAGYALLALGVAAALFAARALGRTLTPYPRPLADGEFCATGPYRFVRHPIYSSVMLLALGWALAWQSLFGLAFLPVLFLFFDLKARREERWLAQKYPAYAGYRQQVKKFFPGIY